MFTQQGDQTFFKIEKFPSKKMNLVEDGRLTKSPVTGHSHRVIDGDVFEHDGQMYVQGPATVVHEEHAGISIPEGIWRMDTVQEYDHLTEEARNVID